MSNPACLAVLDLDGVLVDLHLDTPRLRREVDALLVAANLPAAGADLIAGIASACAQLAARDAGAADRLAARLWALIDEEEERLAPQATPRPGAHALLDSLHGVPLALYTKNRHAAALTALHAASIDASRFFAIQARTAPASLEPSPAPIQAILAMPDATGVERVFVVGERPVDMVAATATRAALGHAGPELIAVAYAATRDRVPQLEAAGADFVVTELGEAAVLVRAPRFPHRLSIVLLAWNEEDSIAGAIRDCRRVGRLWLSGYEIVVIDDGSSDATSARAEATNEGDVRIIRHPRNLGMGAALRDGYAAASCEYITHLPADRQVRPQSLLAFLPHATPEVSVISKYAIPHSGVERHLMSLAFRVIVQTVGGLTVDYAGSYVFHRRWLETIDLRSVRSETFVFSFELLERLRRAGSSFAEVVIRPFAREVGQSREVALRRIARVFGEIVRYRARAFRNRR